MIFVFYSWKIRIFAVFICVMYSTMRREIKYVNGAKRMADFLGPSKDLITLSQVLTYYNSIIKLRGYPRQDTFFLH